MSVIRILAPPIGIPILMDQCGSDGLMLFSSSGAVELLKRLEEVNIRAIQGSGEDYLSVLVKTMKNGSLKDALQRLKVTRLALAKYYAKCTMVGAT